MADITLGGTEVAADWVDITTELSLEGGKSYVTDIASIYGSQLLVYWAETDDATAPTVDGHPIWGEDYLGKYPSRLHKQIAGRRLWMRADTGTVTIHMTPTT